MWLGKTLEFCDYWIEPGILHHQQYFWIDRWFGGGDVISLLGWVDFCQSNLFLIESIWVQRWSMNTQTLSEMWIIRDQCSIHIHTYIYGYLQIIQIIYVYLIIFLFIARISDSIVYTGLYASYIICIYINMNTSLHLSSFFSSISISFIGGICLGPIGSSNLEQNGWTVGSPFGRLWSWWRWGGNLSGWDAENLEYTRIYWLIRW